MSMAQAKQMDIYIKIQYLRRFYRYDKNTFRLPRQYLEESRKSLQNQWF